MKTTDHFNLPIYIRIAVESKFGKPIRYPKDCIALAEDMYLKNRVRISESTLKRMMGFVKGTEQPRKYTLDLLANYLGYTNYEILYSSIQHENTSSFQTLQSIESTHLPGGSVIEFRYAPDRKVILKHAGNQTYEVLSSENSKLKTGDIFQISQFIDGYPLILSDVIRDSSSLGQFVAGKSGGIYQLKILHHEPKREN